MKLTANPHRNRLHLRPPPPTPLRRTTVPSQLLFRELNEEIVLRRPRLGGDRAEIEVVCECERRSCAARVRLVVADYEAVRRFPTRFVIRPGHTAFEDERVVDEHRAFAVVEKIGDAAQLAIRLDPRRLPPDEAA